MLNFRFHPEARKELLHASRHIKNDNPEQAELFKQAFILSLDWARSQPLIFRCFEDDLRKVKVGKFRYSLIFRVHTSEIQILAIAHMSRKPGYWKNREKS